MGLQVVGAGLGRTGTNSLKLALEHLLSGACHHMFEVKTTEHMAGWEQAALGNMPDWHSFLSDFTALVDWPGASFWPELSDAFPEAKVLLSVREGESWYKSASETIFVETDDLSEEFDRMWHAIRDNRFPVDTNDKAATIAAMEAHNAAVIDAIPPERLIVWPTGGGWEPICEGLDLPVPDTPFPHKNTKKEFWEHEG
ncbi:MAG: sulfotransferase family protein [Rhodospirillaceae bacterium]|nr:sulfotransferase family protein [Rhodospirillaceae bacterium]|tara:strand:- start:27466 stop:28059 length:594 start_codon:yes stop_codon:yes gene_type:complete